MPTPTLVDQLYDECRKQVDALTPKGRTVRQDTGELFIWHVVVGICVQLVTEEIIREQVRKMWRLLKQLVISGAIPSRQEVTQTIERDKAQLSQLLRPGHLQPAPAQVARAKEQVRQDLLDGGWPESRTAEAADKAVEAVVRLLTSHARAEDLAGPSQA